MTTQPAGSTGTDRTPGTGAWAGPGSWADAGLVSGEAVELDVRVARVGSRVLALLIDVLVQLAAAVVLLLLTGLLLAVLASRWADGAFVAGLFIVEMVLVLVGYPTLWETLNHGRSPGKLAVGLRVVREDGGPVGFRQALIRALVGVTVEWPGVVLPMVTWVASAATALADPRGRRLGDLAAGTMVVHERVPTVPRYQPVMAPILVSWAGTLDLTRLDDGLALAVRQFLSRSGTLDRKARVRLATALRTEMARVVAPAPPFPVTDLAYLTAVLAERHRRGAYRLTRTRALTATLWPELAPTAWGIPAQSTGSTEHGGTPTPPAVRPAVPS